VQKRFLLAFPILCLGLFISCGGGATNGSGGGTSTGGGGGPAGSPTIQHVGIVIFENQNYADVIGNAAVPYLNSLVQQNALATQFYANVHPCIGNYFMMTTGQVVITDDSFSGTLSGDNVTTALNAAGKTWKLYAESLPQTAYVGGDQYPYIKHHILSTTIRSRISTMFGTTPFSETTLFRLRSCHPTWLPTRYLIIFLRSPMIYTTATIVPREDRIALCRTGWERLIPGFNRISDHTGRLKFCQPRNSDYHLR
jgi:hypothetical protein